MELQRTQTSEPAGRRRMDLAAGIATAGYIYGFAPALGLVIAGWLLTALLSYALGRTIGAPLLRSLLGRRFTKVEDSVANGGVSLLLAGRLIPVVTRSSGSPWRSPRCCSAPTGHCGAAKGP